MEARVRALLPAIVAAWLLAACGGSNGNGGDDPNPNPGGGNSQNPCASASVETELEAPAPAPSEAALRQKRGVVDHNPRWRVFDALWTHRQRIALGGERAAETTGRDSVDVGDVAVIQDEGDVIHRQTSSTTKPGACASLATAPAATTSDDRRRLSHARYALRYGRRQPRRSTCRSLSILPAGQTTAFVNSDGNITFEEEDRASTDRNVARLLTGPPRVAPFLADLIHTGEGRSFVNAAADQYTVTWCGVAALIRTARHAQTTLLPTARSR